MAISSVLGEIRADTQENVLKSPHHKNTDIGRGFSITNVEEAHPRDDVLCVAGINMKPLHLV